MNKIDIAMATYNGELFIEEQIQSIRAQTYTNWHLYISDDGSTDETIQKIKRIMEVDSRISLVNIQRQGGVIRNFNMALMSTNADYVLLSDQDDIWPANRLEMMVIKMAEKDCTNKGVMLFSDLILIDDNGDKIAESFYQSNKINPYENLKKYRLLWHCTVYGCTTIVNRKLLNDCLPIPNTALMHDQWLAVNANRNQGLFYIDDFKTIFYRQHANNVVGGASKGLVSKVKNFKKNIKNIYKSVILIKRNLYGNKGFYSQGNPLLSYFDFVNFAFKEIFPEIFKGDKKIQALFLFLGFVFIK